MNPHIYLITSILLMATSQFLFKRGVMVLAERRTTGERKLTDYLQMALQGHIFVGFALNGLAALAWLLALSQLELSYVFPFLSLNYILIPLGARLLFGEQLTARKLIGISIICCGIFLIALS